MSNVKKYTPLTLYILLLFFIFLFTIILFIFDIFDIKRISN